jgi:malate dehydrogenase (quinone)
LNYTPARKDGTVDIAKAIKIASAFEVSKEFWAWMIRHGCLPSSASFIRNVPHISFVWGEENVSFLQKRYHTMRLHPLFERMEFSDNLKTLREWMPLVMEGREISTPMAATRMQEGTDVDFGELSRLMFEYLLSCPSTELRLNCEVRNLERQDIGTWRLEVHDFKADDDFEVEADFVFIGAGGGALPLLEKSNIEEAEGYGGFPISGQWLVCNNPEVVEKHFAKVYGKASVGAPPMSVPHLDTRVINGEKALLFGPFAGFSTKFLKNGSYWDLPASIELDNFLPMMAAGLQNMSLTRYLIQQVTQTQEDRFKALQAYFPMAKAEDWELAIAGQRVQVIKKDDQKVGVLEFGTELVCASDGSLAALLGASPGASTAVNAMLDVLKKCFPHFMATPEWKGILKQMAPSYGASIQKLNRLENSRKNKQKELGLYQPF